MTTVRSTRSHPSHIWKGRNPVAGVKQIFAVCAIFISILTSPGQFIERAGASQGATTATQFGELERVVLAELSETNAPGAAIGIVSGDQLIFAKGFGTSNVETGAPVSPDTLFRLGSTTKMFTAAALVRLADEGRVRLDEPIGIYASGLDPAIAGITSRQLLSHTAGLKDEAVMFGKHDDSELGVTVRALNANSLFAAPGRVYSYANPGYWLAGYVIEQVSGRPYADEMRDSLFQPLGMTSTTLRPTLAMTYPLSQGHEGAVKEKPHVIRPFADNAGNWPAGSMFSSVNDLSRFVIAFLNGGKIAGKEVLSPSLITTLSTSVADVPGSNDKYGLGLILGNRNGLKVVQHSGSRSGFGSMIRMFPEKRVGIIMLINRTGGTLNKSAEKASELMLPSWKREEPKPPTLAITAAEMNLLAGVYGEGADRVEITIKEGRLQYKRGKTEGRVEKRGDSRFMVALAADDAPLEFGVVRSGDGRAEFLVIGQRAVRRVEK